MVSNVENAGGIRLTSVEIADSLKGRYHRAVVLGILGILANATRGAKVLPYQSPVEILTSCEVLDHSW